MNSVEILDLARSRAGLDSDRQLAKAMGVHESRISLVRNQHRKIDGRMALKIAEVADVPAAYILALVAAERAEDERVALEWRRAAKLLKRGAAAVILATALALGAPHSAEAAPVRVASDQSIHYAQRNRRGAAGPDPRANRTDTTGDLFVSRETNTAGRGWRRRRRRPPGPPAGVSRLTVTALTERRGTDDRRALDRLERDRRHGAAGR